MCGDPSCSWSSPQPPPSSHRLDPPPPLPTTTPQTNSTSSPLTVVNRQTREEQQQTSASSSNPHSSPQRPANLDKRIVKKRRKASGVGGGSLGSLGWVKKGLHYSTLFGDSQTSSRSRSGAAGVSQVSLMSLFITCCMLLNTCGIADARFEETIFYSPCSFNPLCICSNGAMEFGSVICEGVELGDIPIELQEANVFKLRLTNNGMHSLPDNRLAGTGLWELEVSHNELRDIPPFAFRGLDYALWELHLHNNKLTEVPAESIMVLEKLSLLNLSDNSIAELNRNDFTNLGQSLKVLDMSGNSLTSVPEGVFSKLQRLETLYLSRNNIHQIHSQAFQKGMAQLSNLYLQDNLMMKIPFASFSHVSQLKTLDVSRNRIENLLDSHYASGAVKVDHLYLRDNMFRQLDKNAFNNFNLINYTSVRGNPIRNITADAFKNAEIKWLDLSHCLIDNVHKDALRGLGSSLEHIEWTGNVLKQLPKSVFDDFPNMKDFRVQENMLEGFNYTFEGFRNNLHDLNIQGMQMTFIELKEIGTMRNLRSLGISQVKKSRDQLYVGQDVFQDLAPGLEELSLVNAGINGLEKNAFAAIPSISVLDLSKNRIWDIDPDAFKDLGHSLQVLRMSHALYFDELPSGIFSSLIAMCTLDLSDNQISDIPMDTFHKMPKLIHLYLQDNFIVSWPEGTFHSQANPQLKVLDLSFNFITEIPQDTFRFDKLVLLNLDDNKIAKLNKRSFTEMKSLQFLSLDGNYIEDIPDEAFQNLHHVRRLNLAYNKLKKLNFQAFDKVGTLVHLKIDMSHNNLNQLRSNRTTNFPTSSNIMYLDLSWNNISMIETGFFDPVQNVLKVLNLSHNALSEVSENNVGTLRRLFSLDLSYNNLKTVEKSTFFHTKRLYAVYLQYNHIKELDQSLFTNRHKLRIVDLSYNNLTALPETIFMRTSLEIFSAAYNQLKEIPVKALNPVQSTLKKLNLEGNRISTISNSQLNQIQSLTVLRLSNNLIATVDDDAFCCLPNLSILDISFNPLKRLKKTTFDGVSQHLQVLDVANTSLSQLPDLRLNALKEFNASLNQLTFVAADTLSNLSDVRVLDLSHNRLNSPPSNAWHTMLHLNRLMLAGNPFTTMSNDSFMGLDRLEWLDIGEMNGTIGTPGTFSSMPNLRTVRFDINPSKMEEYLTRYLYRNYALESIHLRIDKNAGDFFGTGGGSSSGGHGGGGGPGGKGGGKKSGGGKGGKGDDEHHDDHENTSDKGPHGKMEHPHEIGLPNRLREIVLEGGPNVEGLNPASFKHLNSRELMLRVRTNEFSLDRDLFLNLGRVQNLSIVIDPPIDYNSKNHKLGNPVTGYTPNYPRAVFLEHLRLGGTTYDCSCNGIGWLEKWLRRWRGVYCGMEAQAKFNGMQTMMGPCRGMLRDLREARCAGSKDKSVLQALRNDLECDVFGSATTATVSAFTSLSLALAVTYLSKMLL